MQVGLANKKEQKVKAKQTLWKGGFANKKDHKIKTSEEKHDHAFMWYSSYSREMTHARFKNPEQQSSNKVQAVIVWIY